MSKFAEVDGVQLDTPRDDQEKKLRAYFEKLDPGQQLADVIRTCTQEKMGDGEHQIGNRTITIVRAGSSTADLSLRAIQRVTITSGQNELVARPHSQGTAFLLNGEPMDMRDPQVRVDVNVLLQKIGVDVDKMADAKTQKTVENERNKIGEQVQRLKAM